VFELEALFQPQVALDLARCQAQARQGCQGLPGLARVGGHGQRLAPAITQQIPVRHDGLAGQPGQQRLRLRRHRLRRQVHGEAVVHREATGHVGHMPRLPGHGDCHGGEQRGGAKLHGRHHAAQPAAGAALAVAAAGQRLRRPHAQRDVRQRQRTQRRDEHAQQAGERHRGR
jgi:hypothetical protein